MRLSAGEDHEIETNFICDTLLLSGCIVTYMDSHLFAMLLIIQETYAFCIERRDKQKAITSFDDPSNVAMGDVLLRTFTGVDAAKANFF
ncbi:hypothetical protein AVEN_29345-1 [Araneus ventricosus]|uniref:Uncharacterized protein n=1 Tax=Araneus ventricosus TaxID=182803 RepID=A0A4Y2IYB5_ARAVE|nr:hypothetical protein AVEN_29345-1 [Araneus ventricosus]